VKLKLIRGNQMKGSKDRYTDRHGLNLMPTMLNNRCIKALPQKHCSDIKTEIIY